MINSPILDTCCGGKMFYFDKYVKGYLFDVLKDVGDDEYIATYLRNKGYKVEGNIE